MPTLEYDLGYLRAALTVLDDYLLSADLYWSIGNSPPRGEPPYPSLTLGGVLLAQARAHAHRASGNLVEQIASIHEQINAVRGCWACLIKRLTRFPRRRSSYSPGSTGYCA